MIENKTDCCKQIFRHICVYLELCILMVVVLGKDNCFCWSKLQWRSRSSCNLTKPPQLQSNRISLKCPSGIYTVCDCDAWGYINFSVFPPIEYFLHSANSHQETLEQTLVALQMDMDKDVKYFASVHPGSTRINEDAMSTTSSTY